MGSLGDFPFPLTSQKEDGQLGDFKLTGITGYITTLSVF